MSIAQWNHPRTVRSGAVDVNVRKQARYGVTDLEVPVWAQAQV